MIGRADGGLVPRADEPLGPLDNGRIGRGGDDDFHERHQWRRVEEVETQDSLAMRRQCRDVGDPQG